MRILIDIGHPADVHYFRNLIKLLSQKGYEFQVLARNKDVTHQLLRAYKISFIDKGEGGKAVVDRVKYTIKSITLIKQTIQKFNPDLCISHASPYLALLARFYRLPHIMFNDTEKAVLFKKIIKLCRPEVYSPDSFINLDLKYQTPLATYMELAYLHPVVFDPDSSIIKTVGDDYILLRLVSNKALHDRGLEHLRLDEIRKIVHTLSTYKKVWISSEAKLPDDLKKYELKIRPEQLHDVIAFAALVIGDSATISSEAAMLGVPAIFINQNKLGYISELAEKYKLIYHFPNFNTGNEAALNKACAILKNNSYKGTYQNRSRKMLKEKENLTNLMISIIDSKKIT